MASFARHTGSRFFTLCHFRKAALHTVHMQRQLPNIAYAKNVARGSSTSSDGFNHREATLNKGLINEKKRDLDRTSAVMDNFRIMTSDEEREFTTKLMQCQSISDIKRYIKSHMKETEGGTIELMDIIRTCVELSDRGHILNLDSRISDFLISLKTAEKVTLDDFEQLIKFSVLSKAESHYKKLCSLIYFYCVDSSISSQDMADEATKDIIQTFIQFCSQLDPSIKNREALIALKGIGNIIIAKKLNEVLMQYLKCAYRFNILSVPVMLHLKEVVEHEYFLETIGHRDFTLLVESFTARSDRMFDTSLVLGHIEEELMRRCFMRNFHVELLVDCLYYFSMLPRDSVYLDRGLITPSVLARLQADGTLVEYVPKLRWIGMVLQNRYKPLTYIGGFAERSEPRNRKLTCLANLDSIVEMFQQTDMYSTDPKGKIDAHSTAVTQGRKVCQEVLRQLIGREYFTSYDGFEAGGALCDFTMHLSGRKLVSNETVENFMRSEPLRIDRQPFDCRVGIQLHTQEDYSYIVKSHQEWVEPEQAWCGAFKMQLDILADNYEHVIPVDVTECSSDAIRTRIVTLLSTYTNLPKP